MGRPLRRPCESTQRPASCLAPACAAGRCRHRAQGALQWAAIGCPAPQPLPRPPLRRGPS
eukprot:350136-Chlamydomonas_euryale.AAC.21